MHSLYQSSKILEKNKARLIIGKQKGFLDDSLQPGSNYISSKIRKRKQNQESSGEMSQESEMWSELKGNLSVNFFKSKYIDGI